MGRLWINGYIGYWSGRSKMRDRRLESGEEEGKEYHMVEISMSSGEATRRRIESLRSGRCRRSLQALFEVDFSAIFTLERKYSRNVDRSRESRNNGSIVMRVAIPIVETK